MSEFDTSGLLAARTGFGAVSSLLDDMRVRYKTFYDVTMESSTSTSYVELRSNNITGIETDDLIVMVSSINLSGDAAAFKIRCYLKIGSDASDPLFFTAPGASSAGEETPLTMMHFTTGESGTVACASYWQVQNAQGGSTMYSDRQLDKILVFKNGGEL